MLSDIELLEFLSVKLCHDLAGPIGAISNGLDLMHDSDANMQKNALELVESCANQAVNRIKFFRQLYGISLPAGEANLVEIKSLLDNYFAITKTSIDWPADSLFVSYYNVNHRMGKLIMAIVTAGASLLIGSGVIAVNFSKTHHAGCLLKISLISKNIKIDQISLDILNKDVDSSLIDTKNIQFYLVKRHIKLLDVTLQLLHEDNGLSFIVEFK